MFVLELRVLPVLRRSPEGSGAPMDFADVALSTFLMLNSRRTWAPLCIELKGDIINRNVMVKCLSIDGHGGFLFEHLHPRYVNTTKFMGVALWEI